MDIVIIVNLISTPSLEILIISTIGCTTGSSLDSFNVSVYKLGIIVSIASSYKDSTPNFFSKIFLDLI